MTFQYEGKESGNHPRQVRSGKEKVVRRSPGSHRIVPNGPVPAFDDALTDVWGRWKGLDFITPQTNAVCLIRERWEAAQVLQDMSQSSDFDLGRLGAGGSEIVYITVIAPKARRLQGIQSLVLNALPSPPFRVGVELPNPAF